MALEPITRAEQIIAGKDLQPITRMEKFLKEYGDSSKTIFYYNESSGIVYKDIGFTEILTDDEVLKAFLSAGISVYLELNGYADVFALLLGTDGRHEMYFYHPDRKEVVIATNFAL